VSIHTGTPSEQELAEVRAGLLRLREESTSAEYLLEDATTIIGKIDAALARMDQGRYGTGARCGNPIPLGRLRVRPYEPTCVSCSS
jgi:RNA polymerase-binding transcription factor DksA